MIKKFKYILILIMSGLWGIPFGMSQTWLPMDKGIDRHDGTIVRKIVVDPISDKLYAIGTFVEDGNTVIMRGVAQWKDQHWDSVGLGSEGNAAKLGMTMYKDTLYVYGNFYDNNVNFSLGKWNSVYWDTLTNSPPEAWAFAQKDGILYMGGTYDFFTGDSSYIIHTYDGSHFTGQIPYCFVGDGGYVNALAFYKDTLYLGGYYDLFSCKGFSSLSKWDGNDLQRLSPEFANHGADCNIWCMLEYQGELYIGGYFQQLHGYAGDYIMKWNGNSFSAVGSGMNGRVRCMKVYNNKLYVGGDFTTAGGVASNCLAMWDGNNWNSITTDTFDVLAGATPSVDAIEVYHDSLIIGGYFRSINGDTACRRVAKYNAALTGIEKRNTNNLMRIFPNPASNQITIEFASSANSILEITNIFGQTMYAETIKGISGKQSKNIDLSAFSEGVYFVRLKSEKECVSAKFIKS